MNSVQQKDLVAKIVNVVYKFKTAQNFFDIFEMKIIRLFNINRSDFTFNIINQTLKTTKSGYKLTIKHSQGFPIYYLEKV